MMSDSWDVYEEYVPPSYTYRLQVLLEMYNQHDQDARSNLEHRLDTFCDFWGMVLGDFELAYQCVDCPCISLSEAYCDYRRINAILK